MPSLTLVRTLLADFHGLIKLWTLAPEPLGADEVLR